MYPSLADHWNWHRAMLIEAREAQDTELAKYHEDALQQLDRERRGLAPRYRQSEHH